MADKTPPTSTLPENIVRPIPDRHTWEILLDAYKKVKKDSDPYDQELYEAFASSESSSGSGGSFVIDYEVRQIPNKGRGVFALQDIPKGSKICGDICGRFHTEAQWREFLSSIPHPLAMDCVDWAVVGEDDSDSDTDDDDDSSSSEEEEVENRKFVLYMDFQDCAMMNHGSMKEGKANCKGKEYKENGKWQWKMMATKDINAGEELLSDYSLGGGGVGYNHNLTWYNKIHEEYYPGVPIDESELERFK